MVKAALVYILAPRLFSIIMSICTWWCTFSAGGAKAVFFIVWHWCKVHLSGAEPVSSWCSLHARRIALPPPPAPMSPEREVQTQILLNFELVGDQLTRLVWQDKWEESEHHHQYNHHHHKQCVLKQACSRMALDDWTTTMVSLMTQSDRENSDGEST